MTENTTTTTYNGWSNYATWRVNLELADDVLQHMSGAQFGYIPTVTHLAEYLKDRCEEIVCDYGDADTLAQQYAIAFLGQVNWFEIAENHLRDNPELIAQDANDN